MQTSQLIHSTFTAGTEGTQTTEETLLAAWTSTDWTPVCVRAMETCNIYTVWHSDPLGSAVSMKVSCVHPRCYMFFMQGSALRCVFCCLSQSESGRTSLRPGTVHLAETRQRDSSVCVDVKVGAPVHPLDQVLLVQERVVGTERAGSIVETLVVVAELRLPPRRQELVNMDHLAQRHHKDGA